MSSGDDYDGSSDVSESDLDDVPLSMPSPERKGPGLPMMNRLQIDPMVPESSSSRDAPPVSLGDALATRLELQSGTVLTEEAKPGLPNSESLPHQPPDAAETRPQSPPRSRGLRLIVERPAGGSPLSSPGALTTPESMRDIQTPDGVTDFASRISVELVSHAFTLDSRYLAKAKEKSLSTTEIVTQRCCRSLGVAQEEFQLFELRPLPAGAIPDGVEHVGVAVSKSGFSLHALEDLLVEHKRMAASMERTTSAMEVMQKSIRDKDQKVARLELKTAEHEADSRRWHDRCQSLESENQALRQQLQRSDRLRKQAQQGLMDIRAQFEDFARNYQAVQHHSEPIAQQTNGGVVLSAQQCHKMDVIALRVEDVYGMCEQLAGRLDRLERGPLAESKP